jgi:2-methylisocitrate lyase-like PEP mutase family enzyme
MLHRNEIASELTPITADVAALEDLLAGRSRGGGPLVVAPGCWDAFSARTAEAHGATAVILTPLTMAMARYGRPEVAIITFGELADSTSSIRESVTLPLIVDASGGFGNSLNVYRTVRLFERAGASAIAISDAASPGSLQEAKHERIVSPADMIGKLKAALDSRSDALVIARTLAAETEGLAATFDRAEAYLETGADLLIVDGAADRAAIEGVARRFAGRVGLVHDLLPDQDYASTAADLEGLGYSLMFAPLVLLHAMAQSAPAVLRKHRRVGAQTP